MDPRQVGSLPPLPAIFLSKEAERALPDPERGFLGVRRLDLRALYPDGTQSERFTYDTVTRRALDAVVIVAHYVDAASGRRFVYLRSCVRPPLAFRVGPGGGAAGAGHDAAAGGGLWEMPAGLIEPGETPEEAAARELAEELGFSALPSAFAPLGPVGLPAPALLAERHHFLHVCLAAGAPGARGTPTEDGSPLERMAVIAAVAVEDGIALCRAGVLVDEKTELALRRLAELP